jgi:hypothetical protein
MIIKNTETDSKKIGIRDGNFLEIIVFNRILPSVINLVFFRTILNMN